MYTKFINILLHISIIKLKTKLYFILIYFILFIISQKYIYMGQIVLMSDKTFVELCSKSNFWSKDYENIKTL